MNAFYTICIARLATSFRASNAKGKFKINKNKLVNLNGISVPIFQYLGKDIGTFMRGKNEMKVNNCLRAQRQFVIKKNRRKTDRKW